MGGLGPVFGMFKMVGGYGVDKGEKVTGGEVEDVGEEVTTDEGEHVLRGLGLPDGE